MPLSVFDGEPVEHLHEHYSPAGELTGTTVVSVPGWTVEDRAWALGLAMREAAQCPRGHDLTESLDYGWKWEPQPPAVCFACVAIEGAVKKHEKDPHARAMLHSLRKVKRPKPKKRR